MNISVNGESRDVRDGLTLAALLDDLGARRDGTAVARNGAVVPRADHATIVLAPGDSLEIIVAVAGG